MSQSSDPVEDRARKTFCRRKIMTLVEVADGVTLDQIADNTEAAYRVDPGL